MMNSHRRTSARSNPDSLIGQDTSPDIRVQLETLRGGSSAAKWSTRAAYMIGQDRALFTALQDRPLTKYAVIISQVSFS